MKRINLLSLAVFISSSFTTDPPSSVVGRWQRRLTGGMVVGAIFRPDSSFDGIVNNKLFVSGKYYVRQDTFALADGGCGLNYYGTYKFHFFAEDSVRFTAIQDTCRGRRRANDGLTMGRVKPVQTK